MTRANPLPIPADSQINTRPPQPGTRENHSLLSDTLDGYLVTDIAGTIQEANDTAAAILRTPPDSLRGKPILRYLARDSRKLFLSGIRRLRASSSAEAWDVFLQPHQGPLIST